MSEEVSEFLDGLERLVANLARGESKNDSSSLHTGGKEDRTHHDSAGTIISLPLQETERRHDTRPSYLGTRIALTAHHTLP